MSAEFHAMLFALKKQVNFCFCGDTPEDIHPHIIGLIDCFGANVNVETKTIEITCLLKNDELLRSRIDNYVSEYNVDIPIINRFNVFFREVGNGEHFYFLPNVKELTQKQYLSIHNELFSIEKGIDDEVFNSKLLEQAGSFLDMYSLEGIVSDKKIKIGEGLKRKRVCRFCKNKRQNATTFNQEAHAISESLGNKSLILNEECDGCNKYFSETIERDVDAYFKFFTTFFKVKNKSNKTPKIKGRNFQFSQDENAGNNSLLIYRHKEKLIEKQQNFPPKKIQLEFNSKIKMQNIYKAFVKFSFSVINSGFLDKFEKTIAWISSDHFHQKLPKVAVLRSYIDISDKAEVRVYFRKGNDLRLPAAVGEFQYTFLKYVFIIPTFDKEENDFLNDEDYQYFLNFFKFYCFDSMDWKYECFSDCEEKDFVFDISFNKK